MYISYFFEMLYHFSNLTRFLQVKRYGRRPSKGRERHSSIEEKHSQRVITIDSSRGSTIKETSILPFRAIKGLIIEVLDD